MNGSSIITSYLAHDVRYENLYKKAVNILHGGYVVSICSFCYGDDKYAAINNMIYWCDSYSIDYSVDMIYTDEYAELAYPVSGAYSGDIVKGNVWTSNPVFVFKVLDDAELFVEMALGKLKG